MSWRPDLQRRRRFMLTFLSVPTRSRVKLKWTTIATFKFPFCSTFVFGNILGSSRPTYKLSCLGADPHPCAKKDDWWKIRKDLWEFACVCVYLIDDGVRVVECACSSLRHSAARCHLVDSHRSPLRNKSTFASRLYADNFLSLPGFTMRGRKAI